MILFVDDEPREMESFVDELQFSGYEVKFMQDVDTALEFLKDNNDKIKLVILDVMMPAGKSLKNKLTKEGLRTGFLVYQMIREEYNDLPIILFSNVSEEISTKDIPEDCQQKILNEIQENKMRKKYFYFQKEELFPYELVEQIDKILAQQ